MDDLRKKFGKRISELRKAKGLSQEKLNFLSKIHRTYISEIERGEANVSLEHIGKLAKAFVNGFIGLIQIIMDVELLLDKAQNAFSLLVEKIDRLSIGDRSKFPFGWRKAAKGRTVWRIVEELITQNLEKYHSEFGISEIIVSDSEVSIFDMMCKFDGIDIPVYFNIKSAVQGGKINKDDLSKAEGLISFYEGDINRHYFVATFVISFNDDMTIGLEKAVVFPLAWIPDIYINPSNNGNMQSSKYKDISTAVKRNNQDFFNLLKSEYLVAKGKKAKKSLN